ncbi:MAG TPA: ferredoxin reductase [Mycobacteriales bacterium]|nr:ferredoxin reductase [Mycobacteriales bacterium]
MFTQERTWTRLARRLSTPLLPEDYVGLVDPLVGSSSLRTRVVDVRPEAAGATTLVLQPGQGWTGHRAGQYVRLGVEVDGVLHWRSYSLTAPPRPDGRLTVTVGHVPGGRVSEVLAATAPGAVLRLEPAAGDFVLDDAPRLLFLTGGTGLTPVMGMLRELAGRRDVVVVHSARTRDHVLFADELRALPAVRLLERHTDVDGLLAPEDLDALVPDWRERSAWACGPAGMLDALEAHWTAAGLPLRTERFAPARTAVPGAVGGTVAFTRSGTTVQADGGTALLDAGEGAGVLLPSGCRMGICFGCVVPLLDGQVRDVRTGAVHGEPGDLVQTCISAPCGDVDLDA